MGVAERTAHRGVERVHRAVALTGGDDLIGSDAQRDGGMRGDLGGGR